MCLIKNILICSISNNNKCLYYILQALINNFHLYKNDYLLFVYLEFRSRQCKFFMYLYQSTITIAIVPFPLLKLLIQRMPELDNYKVPT